MLASGRKSEPGGDAMKRLWLMLFTVLLIAGMTVQADGPGRKGKGGKPADLEELGTQKQEEAEEQLENKEKSIRKGFEKQKQKKSEQVQKELDKGSEQGKAMRQEHRRKWWKFWGSESEE
jgi:hypothetical protein